MTRNSCLSCHEWYTIFDSNQISLRSARVVRRSATCVDPGIQLKVWKRVWAATSSFSACLDSPPYNIQKMNRITPPSTMTAPRSSPRPRAQSEDVELENEQFSSSEAMVGSIYRWTGKLCKETNLIIHHRKKDFRVVLFFLFHFVGVIIREVIYVAIAYWDNLGFCLRHLSPNSKHPNVQGVNTMVSDLERTKFG